jgi:hypothetical protein
MSSVKSQSVSLRDLWSTIAPSGFKRQLFMLLRGYADESYGDKVFVLASLVAPSGAWLTITQAWRRFLKGENKRLGINLERFHASDCYCGKAQFEGIPNADRFSMTKRFMEIATSQISHATVFIVHFEDLRELYSGGQHHLLKCAYEITTAFTIDYFGEQVGGLNSSLSLVVEGATANQVILDTYNAYKEDPNYKHGNVFKSIAFQNWRDCVALQPSDLIAYYAMKEAVRYKWKKDASLNPIFDSLLHLDNFGIAMKYVPKRSLQKLTHYKYAKLRSGV